MQLVFIQEGKAVTDSLIVAEFFEKKHNDVLRDIRTQLDKLGEAGESRWGMSNFAHTPYVHPQNGQTYYKYEMTEDGFAIIAMSYVTPAAMKMKVRFLEEFKRMREQLQALSTPSYAIEDPVARAQRWIEERKERDRIETERLLLAEKVEEQAERLTYLDEIMRSEDTLTISQIAADYGLTARQLNAVLKEAGVQRRVSGQWILCARHLRQGLTKSVTHAIPLEGGGTKTVLHTRWTQAGRLLIHETLAGRGIQANRDRGIDPGVLVIRPTVQSARKEATEIKLSLRINA